MKWVYVVYASFILFVVTSLFGGGDPATCVRDSDQEIVAMNEFNYSMWQAFFKGEMPGVILECPEGMNFPFDCLLHGDFFAVDPIDEAPYTIRILKTCFVRCEGGDRLLFSSDLQSWKEFQEFFTGTIGVSFSEDSNQISLNMQLKQRD